MRFAVINDLHAHFDPGSTAKGYPGANKRGRDFFEWAEPVDWIVTNSPWSQIRDFLCHAMEMADHVVFRFTIKHLWTKARLRDIHNAAFGIREIVLVDMPKNFPQSGFQLGAVHLQYGWKGKITLSELGV